MRTGALEMPRTGAVTAMMEAQRTGEKISASVGAERTNKRDNEGNVNLLQAAHAAAHTASSCRGKELTTCSLGVSLGLDDPNNHDMIAMQCSLIGVC
jgi:hypothetical protein